jgi:hypothetical protein
MHGAVAAANHLVAHWASHAVVLANALTALRAPLAVAHNTAAHTIVGVVHLGALGLARDESAEAETEPGYYVTKTQFVVGCAIIFVAWHFGSRALQAWRIRGHKSAAAISSFTVLANVAASYLGVCSEALRAPASPDVAWFVSLAQTSLGMLINLMLVVTLAVYTPRGSAAWTRLWVTGYVVTVCCLGVTLASVFGPALAAQLLHATEAAAYLPALADVLGYSSASLTAVAWVPQIVTTYRTPRPETQHPAYAGISAAGPVFVGGYQFVAGASWSLWLPSAVPAFFAGVDAAVLFARTCGRPRQHILLEEEIELPAIDPEARPIEDEETEL